MIDGIVVTSFILCTAMAYVYGVRNGKRWSRMVAHDLEVNRISADFAIPPPYTAEALRNAITATVVRMAVKMAAGADVRRYPFYDLRGRHRYKVTVYFAASQGKRKVSEEVKGPALQAADPHNSPSRLTIN